MLQLLKSGIAELPSDHVWQLLEDWHLKQILRQMKLRSVETKLPPFSDVESYRGQGRILTILYIRLIRKDLRALRIFLMNCDVFRVRQLVWQRFTNSSILDETYLPPSGHELLNSTDSQKHQQLVGVVSSSCGHSYWEDESGTFRISSVVEYFVEEFTWWNTYVHPELGNIYELRDRTGHGLRWDMDRSTVVEFLEPDTDDVLFTSSR